MGIDVKVRMYRLKELGDCFLLRLGSGADVRSMLIDCGSFRNSTKSIARLKEIAEDIKSLLAGRPLDVVIGTHQHNDHVNGFLHCSKIFKKIGVGEVWLSWLDNPEDALAQRMADDLVKLKKHVVYALNERERLKGKGAKRRGVAHELIESLGVSDSPEVPSVPRKAVDLLQKLGERETQYLYPGKTWKIPGLAIGSVRVHVLGPPLDHDRIRDIKPDKTETYDPHLMAAEQAAADLIRALRLRGKRALKQRDYPFNDPFKRENPKRAASAAGRKKSALSVIQNRYRNSQTWRQIDDDWMNQADALALYLDRFTNNSSLALAIEFVESGKVLLFPADAQTGNWQSWFDLKWSKNSVTAAELLKRTVLYKVGHHGSHNGTLVAALELMTDPRLSALMPVNDQDANIRKKTNPWRMPAANLERRLLEKTKGRILRLDGRFAKNASLESSQGKKRWKEAGIAVEENELYFEIRLDG